MRLLHTKSFALEVFFGNNTPPYAILSHTWGQEEVLFEHVNGGLKPGTTQRLGWAKVRYSCAQAASDGYGYVWIDTCCIDKSSSAELSEAINSMFKWYQDADICYAYLEDVDINIDLSTPTPRSAFPWLLSASRWFTRGWTLQELIAPQDVRFYSRSWMLIASRQDDEVFARAIEKRTGIPLSVLKRDSCCYVGQHLRGTAHRSTQKCPGCHKAVNSLDILNHHSIAERMSWAASRQTTRIEDQSYCLLGLFGVHMPLLYGEESRAFIRLQEEIIKISDDQSIFAFANQYEHGDDTLLARSPDAFDKSCVTFLPKSQNRQEESSTMILTSKYIQTKMTICPCTVRTSSWDPEPSDSDGSNVKMSTGVVQSCYLGILSCGTKSDLLTRPAILLSAVKNNEKTFRRINNHVLLTIRPLSLKDTTGIDFEPLESINCTYDLQDATSANIHLLLTKPDNERSDASEETGETTSALRVIYPPQVKWVLACPNNGSRRKNAVISQGSGQNSTITRDCRYFPSTKSPSLCSDDNSDKDPIGRNAILCFFLQAQQIPLWVVWGTMYGAFSRRPGDPPEDDEFTRPWCRILQPRDAGGRIPSDIRTLADLRSWATSELAGCFEFVKGRAELEKLWELEPPPSGTWDFQDFDSLLHKSHSGVDYFVVAEIREVEFLGSTMYELEIKVMVSAMYEREIKVITSGDGADKEETRTKGGGIVGRFDAASLLVEK